MSKTAIFVYRCRHCGEVFRSCTECSADCAHAHLVAAMVGIGYPTPNQPPVALMTWHNCDSDKVGLADLSGYIEEEDV